MDRRARGTGRGQRWSRGLRTATALVFVTATAGATTDLTEVIGVAAAGVQAEQKSQRAVDEIVQQTESLEAEYRRVLRELDGLEVYNEYLGRQIEDQEEELDGVADSIEDVGSVERQIMPLMIRMLDALAQFVELDLPFLPEERRDRVERLRSMMTRADVSVAEKFRRLTEAFQIENDFGRTIETYRDTLEIEGATLEVDVLRLGRLGLYYQTNDASRTGRWDRDEKRWVPLSGGSARNEVRRGIRIARRQVAPDLILLEVPVPERVPVEVAR